MKCKNFNSRKIVIATTLAIALPLVSGTLYRHLSASTSHTTSQLLLPLSTLPHEIDQWKGVDIDLSEQIARIAGSDDAVSRMYDHKIAKQWAFIYVAYWADPRLMIGHSPKTCYTATGWTHKSSDIIKFTTSAGIAIRSTLHRFKKPETPDEETVVLDFYVINGTLSSENKNDSGFQRITRRTSRKASQYAAHIQISSSLESSVRQAAHDMTDTILKYLPDENGSIAATDNIITKNTTTSDTDNRT